MPDSTADFFLSPTDSSQVKASIVAKYAHAWARIMSDFLRSKTPTPEVAYVDLFCGPGSYDDGTPSTPSLILKKATQDPKLTTSLRTYFNDIVPESVALLSGELEDFPGLELLTYQPVLTSRVATLDLVKSLAIPSGTPRLYFLDQFGYKHVTLEMISTLLGDWGAECIFFFNYRRVIAALDNPAMVSNVRSVFGDEKRVAALKAALVNADTSVHRESIVLDHLTEALKSAGAKFVQCFSFKAEDTHRSTHHLIFVTKHGKGYTLMKGIMAKAGTSSSEGIPSMSFIQKIRAKNLDLFERPPLKLLGEELLVEFAGQTLSVYDIFLKHGPKTTFVPENYRMVLLDLEQSGQITASPPLTQRPIKRNKPTMALGTRVHFNGSSN